MSWIKIPYDENSDEQNNMPPLAISEWQEYDDVTGTLSTGFELALERAEEWDREHPEVSV